MAETLEGTGAEPRWWYWDNPAPQKPPSWSLGPLPGAYPPAHTEWNPALVSAPLPPGTEELLANPEFLALLQQAPDQEKIMQYAYFLQLAAMAQPDLGAAAAPPKAARSPSGSVDLSTVTTATGGSTQPSPRRALDLDEQRVVEAVYSRYLREPGSASPVHGTTLMCHDLLNKFKVEPDLLQIFQDLGVLECVDYVYLPLTYLKTGTAQKVKKACRNKGYCFVHFSTPEAAETFSAKVPSMVLPGSAVASGKHIHSSAAKFQGVAANLAELLDLDTTEWRARTGYVHIRLGGKLERVGLNALRSFVEEQRAQ